MNAHEKVQPAADADTAHTDDPLAEVFDLPVEVPSFYQKNGRSLPKSGQRATDAQRRQNLPSISHPEDSLLDRIRQAFGR